MILILAIQYIFTFINSV